MGKLPHHVIGFSVGTQTRTLKAPTGSPMNHIHSLTRMKQWGKSTTLQSEVEGRGETPTHKIDPVVRQASVLLRRLSWFTWWSQLILTTVSSVTLLFARNVIVGAAQPVVRGVSTFSPSLPNFLLAGISIALSFFSIFWTWANRRLARRLLRKPTPALQAATMLRRSIHTGVTLNLIGMLTSLISAEQIVGTLAIKVLTSAPARSTVALIESTSNYLQPLDILVVQANTNTLFSHFTSLVALLYMTRFLPKLDPRSDSS